MKEPEGDSVGDDLPDRPLSAHRNLVTPAGLAQMDAMLETLRAEHAAARAAGHKQAVAAASRDLRYWTARRASAECVEPSAGRDVRFGSTVTIERGNGRRQTFRIVGEDEADPSKGTVSYVAPLARALLGKGDGDEIDFMGDTIAIRVHA